MLRRVLVLALLLVVIAACSKRPPVPPDGRTAHPTPESPYGWTDASHRDALLAAPIGTIASVPGMALLDTSGSRVFVIGSAGTLDIVDALSGAMLGRQPFTAAPLFLLGDAVAILDGERRVILLDRAGGRARFRSQPTDIASGDAIDRVTSKSGVLEIAWHTVHHPNLACCGGGIPTTTTGSVAIDLRTGRATLGARKQTRGDLPPAAPLGTALPAPPEPFPRLELAYDEHRLEQNGWMTQIRSIRATDASGRELWRHRIPPVTYDARPRPEPASAP